MAEKFVCEPVVETSLLVLEQPVNSDFLCRTKTLMSGGITEDFFFLETFLLFLFFFFKQKCQTLNKKKQKKLKEYKTFLALLPFFLQMLP